MCFMKNNNKKKEITGNPFVEKKKKVTLMPHFRKEKLEQYKEHTHQK